MSSDEDSAGQPPGKSKRGRPPKPPLTIDLAANASEPPPETSPAPPTAPGEATEPPAVTASAPGQEASAGETVAETPVAGNQAGSPPGGTTATAEPVAQPEPAAAAPASRSDATSSRDAPVSRPPSVPQQTTPAVRPRRAFGYAVAGLIGAIAALIVVLAVEESGVLPSPGKIAADVAAAKAETASAGMAALEKRVVALESAVSASAGDAKGINARLDTIEAAEKATADRVGKVESALQARPQTGNANVDQALDDVMARLEKLEAAVAKGGSVAPPTGLSDLEDRIAVIESSTAAMSQRLAALQARPAAASDSEKAARALAIGTLRRAAGEAAPFAGDLAMLQALGLDETDIAALRPLAEKGAPPRSELASTFPEIADRILATSAAIDPNAGFFDRLAGFARGLVTVRPTAPIPGDTPDAIVSRMQAAVDHGDLAKALSERDALPKNAKAISAAWAQGASDRLTIDRLVEKLSRAVGASGAGE